MRFRQIESDLENIDHADRLRSINRGWSFFIIGMIKKVLLADSIAAIINPALTDYSSLSTVNTWLCILGYTYQLYFDFSGYSDMAVGLGYMFGIRLPQNFNSPYKSVDISDFWRRWHISLSTCLRDYLYIPLGGSRDGGWKTYQNLLITMLFGGLWHGANWTFVFWGGYHGVLLGLNRLYKERIRRLHVGSSRALTFFAVVLGWLFFRATDFHMASVMLNHMFTYHPGPALTAWQGLAMLLVIACAIAHFAQNTFELEHDWGKITSGVLAVGYVACLAIIAGGSVSPFLYFQF